jgi:non-canonical (house-cleaning) NTP pyrophosphatase
MKIAVGTKSDQKIAYLKEVLEELELDFSLIPFEVSSKISKQPLSSKETRIGSFNRAKSALSKSLNCDFAIGIEVGYHPNKKGKYHMLCWATVVDSKDKISSKSEKILLPDFYQKLLQENKYLNDYVDQYLQKNQTPPHKYIASILKSRKPFIQTAIKTVLVNYLVKT